MRKIYFNEKPLYLTDEPDDEVRYYASQPGTSIMWSLDVQGIDELLQSIQGGKAGAGIIIHPDEEASMQAVKKRFDVVIAAGGFVRTKEDELLLIFRRGKWDLPKGKQDEGESLEACALREVEEETKIKGLKPEKPLMITWHAYRENERDILKENHWFLMKAPKTELQPQTEEDIEECKWVPFNQLAPYLCNTHPSIIDVIKKGVLEAG